MPNKNIYFFTAQFPYGKGEQFIETEIKYLAKGFEKIFIIPYGYGFDKNPRPLPKNVITTKPIFSNNKYVVLFEEIFNLAPIRPLIKTLVKELLKKRFYCTKYYLKELLRIRKILSDNKIKRIFKDDLTNTILYFYWGNLSANIISFIKCNNPIIVRFHRGDLYEYLEENICGFVFRDKLLKKLSFSIFISDDGSRYLHNRYSDINFKSKVSRLGVSDFGNSRQSKDGVFRVVSCSSVIQIKRLDIILEALKLITSRILWIHIGDGPLLNKLKNQAKKLPHNIEVNFRGFLNNIDVRKFYVEHYIDLFINVSDNEGVPVSIMEALSSSIPVFAKESGGTKELVDDMVGKIMPSKLSPELLAVSLNEFINLNSEEIVRKRLNAKKRWEEMANAEKVYNEFTEFLTKIE